jgi:4-hydroxy-2-oxoheptanedioate aldolase
VAAPSPLGTPESPALGGWCALGSPLAAELLAQLPLDYVCVDLQHGLAGLDGLPALLQSISAGGAAPLVRVPGNEPWLIGRVLDLGARGVIVPLVSSALEAERAARACRYPPAGGRSWGAVRTYAATGTTTEQRNAAVLCIPMIETVEGVAELEMICRTPGVDAVYVGPTDLRLGHGLEPGADLDAIIDAIAARARACSVPAGLHTRSGEAARRALERGFQFATIASDRELLAGAAARELAAAGRPAEPRPPGGTLRAAATYT